MSMESDLLDKGIRLRSYAIGSHKTTCPKCSHTRKNKKDPCLWVNIKEPDLALFKCHNCPFTGAAGNVTKHAKREQDAPRQYVKPRTAVAVEDAPNTLPQAVRDFFDKRGITEEVLTRNKIYFDDGAICFPYYVGADLLNVKYRTLDKKFRMVKDAQLTFYGLNDIDGASEIIIVEGEMDKLALEVCGFKNVISVPNGAQKEYRNADAQLIYVAHAAAQLKAAKKVIIATDNDQPGEALRLEIARRVGLEKCWSVRWTGDVKDANDSLMKHDIDQTILAIQEAKAFPIKGLYEVCDFNDSLVEYYEKSMFSGVSTGFENLNDLYTIMTGEMTVVTGVPGSGKSEFMDAILTNVARNEDWRFAIFSPEHGKEGHVVKLTEKVMGITSNPKSHKRMTTEQMLEGAAWINNYFYFIIADDIDALPTVDWILDKASVAVIRYGIKGLLIDPWNQIEHARDSHLTESEYVGKMLAKIARWARNHAVAVWIVAHPTKMQADKDGNIQMPSLYSISGSANWVNRPDVGLIVHRTPSKAAERTGITEIHIRKMRTKHLGNVGETTMKYEKDTGRYTPAITREEREAMEEASAYERTESDIVTFEHGGEDELPF